MWCRLTQLILQGRVQTSTSLVRRSLSSVTSNSSSGGKGDSSQSTSGKDTYQVPEYHRYKPFSYYDIDVAMVKHRLEQPQPGGKY
ncbi:uncharacterized protein LOC135333377 [Halichondria panicea]|uniref:uncharacterized protein LOC135333377 n=1 Tax=Halichondria panicea TaxID=6063 RepID=UPI00312BC50A